MSTIIPSNELRPVTDMTKEDRVTYLIKALSDLLSPDFDAAVAAHARIQGMRGNWDFEEMLICIRQPLDEVLTVDYETLMAKEGVR